MKARPQSGKWHLYGRSPAIRYRKAALEFCAAVRHENVCKLHYGLQCTAGPPNGHVYAVGKIGTGRAARFSHFRSIAISEFRPDDVARQASGRRRG